MAVSVLIAGVGLELIAAALNALLPLLWAVLVVGTIVGVVYLVRSRW